MIGEIILNVWVTLVNCPTLVLLILIFVFGRSKTTPPTNLLYGGDAQQLNIISGGPTKLPAKGGGQQQRPGKEEPLVGKEAGRNQRPTSMLEPVLGGVLSSSEAASLG